MSFTRFHDDDLRIEKQLEQQTFIGRYQLDVPGPGATMPFQDDAQLRMQKWGANLQTNSVNLDAISNYALISAITLFGLAITYNWLIEYMSKLLINHGIYVRDCSDKIGLDGEYLRIAARTDRENNLIYKALKLL